MDDSNEAPAYKLYPLSGIVMASFLGSPATGTFLIGQNFKRLGDLKKARWAWILGILGTLALFGLGSQFSGSVGRALAIAGVYSTYDAAKRSFSKVFKTHVEKGGQKESLWKCLGIGLMGFFILIAAGLLILEVTGTMPTS